MKWQLIMYNIQHSNIEIYYLYTMYDLAFLLLALHDAKYDFSTIPLSYVAVVNRRTLAIIEKVPE